MGVKGPGGGVRGGVYMFVERLDGSGELRVYGFAVDVS